MAEAQERLLEVLPYRIHQLQYRKRTEIAVEIVRQLEAEGQFPQAHLDNTIPPRTDALKLVATLYAQDTLEMLLLPGFSCQLASVFFSLSAQGK